MGSITLKMQHPALYSEAGDVVRLFYGDTPLTLYREGDMEPEADVMIVQRARREGEGYLHEAVLTGPDRAPLTAAYCQQEMGEGTLEQKRYFKYGVKIVLYHLLTQATGKAMPWGSLTGIRPTKLAYELLAQGRSVQQAAQYLKDTFDVSREKADLLFQILKAHPLLPVPLHLLLVCGLRHPQKPQVGGTLPCGAAPRDQGVRADGPAGRLAGTRRIFRRGHAHGYFRTAAMRAAGGGQPGLPRRGGGDGGSRPSGFHRSG